jgi:hypothetical protein
LFSDCISVYTLSLGGVWMKGRTHFIKIAPVYFAKVVDKSKKCEIRNNDRKYKVGDIVVLMEYDKEKDFFSGRTATVEITYITTYEQKRNMVVFSFALLACCLNYETNRGRQISSVNGKCLTECEA